MNAESLLQFLEDHQPMEDHPPAQVLKRYREATAWFFEHPNQACIPLFLHSFGHWEDPSLFESVQAVLRRFPKEQVQPHLLSGLASPHHAVRLWCSDTARLFPHNNLLPALSLLIEDEEVMMRLTVAAALEAIGSGGAREVAARALERETDEQVREILLSV